MRSGLLAGLLGTLADFIIYVLSYFILGTSTVAHYISQLIFPFQEPNTTGLILGSITHFVVGSIIGILFALFYKYFGYDYANIKGIGVGLLLWIVHVGIIPLMVSPRPFLHSNKLESFVELIVHISYGIFTTMYLVRKSAYAKYY